MDSPANTPLAPDASPSVPSAPVFTGFPTVEAAVNSMPEIDRAKLGARLLGRYGHLIKKREAGRSDQLSLLTS